MTDIKSMNLEELKVYVASLGEKAFRAKQLYEWMHVKLVDSFDEMTNLSKDFREKLKADAELTLFQTEQVQTSKEDGTQKYLFRTSDNNYIESVRMVYHHGVSVCISSQIGCRMGCNFCASTIGGVIRNLTAAEMLDQIYRIQKEGKERVSNIVVMGMGEPFDNYDNLLRFLHMITDQNGLNISARNITVSTCGIVPGIRKFAEEDLPITLALSLHASNQKTREEMMPVAKSWPLNEVLDACQYYFDKTGRRITFEYSMADGINDSEESARELGALLRGKNCHINLIPINPVREKSYEQSTREAILRFKKKLEKNGINVTIRREMGRDIDGACGQLRKRYIDTSEL
jgi:23S rRNA (adenine2503-C2)-methyltransferase